MKRYRWMCAALVLVLSFIFSAVSRGRSQSQSEPSPEDGRVAPSREWPLVGGDWTNQRYSTLGQINTQNVKNLGAAWVSKEFEENSSSRSTPVVKNGLMYLSAGTRIYALSAKTGEVVWSLQTEQRPGAAQVTGIPLQRAALGVPNSQGVGAGDGKIFAALMDGRVLGIDAETGKVAWSHQAGDDPPLKKEGRWIGEAPTYARGVVYVGMAGDYGMRGRMVALDAKTGQELWHFFTIPGPGEMGHNTWPPDTDAWKWGGGGIWQTATIDVDLGLIYISIGNPVPQWGGDTRPGDNLFTASVLALNIKTGTLKWYYQVIHHDIWDADGAAPTPLILYDAEVNGKKHKAVAAMRADGFLFLLDRENGKPLFTVEERPVPQDKIQKTSPTQPFPMGADSLLPDCSVWKGKVPAGFTLGCYYTPLSTSAPNVMSPWFSVRTSPMAYSPQTGFIYASAPTSLDWRRRSDDPYYWAVVGHVPGPKGFGIIAAIDSRTQKFAWLREVPTSDLGRGGMLTTAGGLLFRQAGDGNFTAMDSKTGDVLWQFQTGFVGISGPPSAFEIDGEEYIAVSAGRAAWTFKLGGTVPARSAPKAITASEDGFAGPIEDTNQVETMTLQADIDTTGHRYYLDDYSFSPYRARIKTGARMVWVNNGKSVHTITAPDGSWTTGPINPGAMGFATFDKPGQYSYICKEHPWSYGQIIVVDQTESTQSGFYTAEQAQRGKGQFSESCSMCHGADLSGRDRAPALAGDLFLSNWAEHSVVELFERIRTTMPQSNPGSLSPAAYLDIIAYLLQANNFPPGSGELKNEPDVLKTLKLNLK